MTLIIDDLNHAINVLTHVRDRSLAALGKSDMPDADVLLAVSALNNVRDTIRRVVCLEYRLLLTAHLADDSARYELVALDQDTE